METDVKWVIFHSANSGLRGILFWKSNILNIAYLLSQRSSEKSQLLFSRWSTVTEHKERQHDLHTLIFIVWVYTEALSPRRSEVGRSRANLTNNNQSIVHWEAASPSRCVLLFPAKTLWIHNTWLCCLSQDLRPKNNLQ